VVARYPVNVRLSDVPGLTARLRAPSPKAHAGNDPITSYMDDTDDPCIDRLAWTLYR
jgi:hypothetical protein